MKIVEIVGRVPPHIVRRRGGIRPDDYFVDRAEVLYHGTTLKRAEQILHQDIQPTLGEFIRSVYPRANVKPVVLATDTNFKRNILGAIRFHLAMELYASPDAIYEVTIPDFIQHGAVVEIRTDRSKFRQSTAMHKPQRGIETFDYYSFEPVKVDRIISGNELVSFFGESFLWSYLRYE